MHNYKPDNYPTVSPYLLVRDAAATIQFLQTLLNAQLLYSQQGETGKIQHAEIRIDDSVIMLADANKDWPGQDSHVHIYVADVDASYQQALAAGASSVQAPIKKNDPDKRCGVRDSGGTTWWLASRQA